MTKLFHKMIAVSAAAAALASGSTAFAADTATADARAEILSTLSLAVRNASALDFGQIANNGGGDVVVTADGTRSCGALLICVGSYAPVVFDVTGTADTGVVVTLPTTAATLTGAGSGQTMSLDTFTEYFPVGNTLVGGTTSFQVGGTLHVGASQAADVYTGQFVVSVEYQ